MEHDSTEALLFMKKMRKPSDVILAMAGSNKKSLKGPQEPIQFGHVIGETIIEKAGSLDDDRERRKELATKSVIRAHTHFQSIPDYIFYTNIEAVAQLAAYLYLDADTVLQYTYYWLGEYGNNNIPREMLFNNMIEGILSYLPCIEIHGQYGLKYTSDRTDSYTMLLRFAGSELHSVPHAHFISRNNFSNPDRENASLLKGFAYIINPHNRCFMSTYTPGLRSEFAIDQFIYNTVLEEFFEPSFLVITCYMHNVRYINNQLAYNLFAGKQVTKKLFDQLQLQLTQKKMELVGKSIIVLEQFIEKHTTEGDIIADGCCIDVNDEYVKEKMARLLYDLITLVLILKDNIHHIDTMQTKVDALWLEKSNYCAAQMGARAEKIFNKL